MKIKMMGSPNIYPPGSENVACAYRGRSESSGDRMLSWLKNVSNRHAAKKVLGSNGCFAEAIR